MVAALEAERDALRAEVEHLRERETEIGRKLYRRGYLTGYMAGKQRRPRETAPERHARGWAREMLS
jgi:hypothetical protein